MSFKFFPTELFMSEERKLKKSYPNISRDLKELRDRLKDDPITGNDSLGSNCYKVRMELSVRHSLSLAPRLWEVYVIFKTNNLILHNGIPHIHNTCFVKQRLCKV